MNKYNNPRLLNAVVSGTGMKHPIQPHVVVGDVSNGFIRGDLMDANAIVDLVNSGDAIDQETIRQAVANIIGTAPENLDTLGEIVEALDAAVLDPNTEGSLANQISVINTTIEDNELTIAAALNDLNSRLLELVTRVDALDGGGDTPVQTLNIALRIGGGSVFAPAAIIGDILHVYISAEGGNDTSNRWVVNADGKILANNGAPLTQAEYTDLTKANLEAEGYETSSCVWEYKEFELNETISDWDSYIKI